MPTKRKTAGAAQRGRPPADSETTLGRFLRAARVKRGLPLEKFAALAGVSAQTASHWERGTKAPAGDRWLELARILGCDVGALATAAAG